MGRLFFAKYKMTQDHPNYFDLVDPVFGDTLSITKNYEIPRLKKQLTDPSDFTQIQYGDAEINLSLKNDEVSQSGQTITDFFEELHTGSLSYDTIKCLCIIDNDTTRWAGFVYLPIDYNYSYNSSDGMTLTLKVYDAMVEWKAYAENLVPAYYFQDNIDFTAFLNSLIFSRFFLYFQNDFTFPAQVPLHILNKSLYVWARAGSDNFTIYNIVKGIAVGWGLVYKFEVPAAYLGIATGGDRVPLTFRLFENSSGSSVTLNHLDYYRTQLPKINQSWILVVNQKYTTTYSNSETFEVVMGVLMSENQTYNFDNYDYAHTYFPTVPTCFTIDSNMDDYRQILTVWDFNEVVRQIDLSDVLIIENDLFTLDDDDIYSLKFGNGDTFVGSQSLIRSNSKIAPHRLFCSYYYPEPNAYGIGDTCTALNQFVVANNNRLLLKNNNIIKSEISLLDSEPDLFDTFNVTYKGVVEEYSITDLDIDTQNRKASMQAIKLPN